MYVLVMLEKTNTYLHNYHQRLRLFLILYLASMFTELDEEYGNCDEESSDIYVDHSDNFLHLNGMEAWRFILL